MRTEGIGFSRVFYIYNRAITEYRNGEKIGKETLYNHTSYYDYDLWNFSYINKGKKTNDGEIQTWPDEMKVERFNERL